MWWMTAMVDGRRVCKSTGTTNKRVAQKRQEAWRTGTLRVSQLSWIKRSSAFGETGVNVSFRWSITALAGR
jgi:hypothetical protein